MQDGRAEGMRDLDRTCREILLLSILPVSNPWLQGKVMADLAAHRGTDRGASAVWHVASALCLSSHGEAEEGSFISASLNSKHEKQLKRLSNRLNTFGLFFFFFYWV